MSTKLAYALALSFFSFVFFTSCDRGGGSGRRGVRVESPGPATPEVGRAPKSEGRQWSDGRPVSYDVYMENSASMDGYVTEQGSAFKNDVQGLIKDLLEHKIADTVNLAYVSEDICPFRHNAVLADVDAFTTQQGLRSCAGRKESLMDRIIEKVLAAKPQDVTVLISDFIFSTGKGSSAELLTQQGHKVESILAARKDLSTMILKLHSGFTGMYYSETGHAAIPVKGISRPYYVMIFGDQGKVRRLEQFIKGSGMASYDGFENIFYLLPPGSAAPAAKLVRKEKIGDFEIAGAADGLTIQKAVPDSSGVFQFAVAMSLDSSKMDERYLMSPSSYELPSNFKIAAIRRVNSLSEPALQGFSHVFLVQTSNLQPSEQVTIRLKTVVPSWVDSSSTIYDDNPTDLDQQRRTFGFSYLVRGVFEGYTAAYNNTDQWGVTVSVNTGNVGEGEGGGQGRSGGYMWLLVVVAVFVVIIIIVKKKR